VIFGTILCDDLIPQPLLLEEKGRNRHRYGHARRREFEMLEVALENDFARSEATKQSISTLPWFISTKDL
jgi:hypothetical protein